MKIEKPCTQNYSAMPLQGEGRHCSQCDKVVVDFRKMNDAELKNYFAQHVGENVCGKLKSYQVNENNFIVKQILSFRHFILDRINFTPLKLALLALISGLLTFTTSCMGMVQPSQKKENLPAKDTVEAKKNVNEKK